MEHRGRDIPWLKVVRFHEEIVKRAERGFYALNANDTLSNRWTNLSGFDPEQKSGPWTLPTGVITSRPFSQAIEAGEHDAVYIGGPCFQGSENVAGTWYPRWQPILYREVSIEHLDSGIRIEPAQGEWNISPLLLELMDQKNIALPADADQFATRLIELAAGRRSAGNLSAAQSVLDALRAEFPDLETDLTRHLRQNSFKSPPTPWVLFAPTSQFSALTRHLLRDYDRLGSNLEKDHRAIGGLAILDDRPSKAGRFDYEAMPVVPLDEAQKRAVDAVLKGDPLTVISGPPGCGKSQVVVSLLLNAWARGLKVLFASNNNKAVDVVRERLERFELDTPIAVRAGNKSKAKVEEVLRRVINLVAQVRRGETRAVDATAVAKRQAVLLENKAALQTSLDSGLPQRIHEAVESALKGYSEHKRLLGEVETAETTLLSEFARLQLPAKVKPAELPSLILEHKDWLNGVAACRQSVEEDRRTAVDLDQQLETLRRNRTHLLAEIGTTLLPPGDGKWLQVGPSIGELEVIATGLKTYAESLSKEDLEETPWNSGYDRWSGEKEATAWQGDAGHLASNILGYVSTMTPVFKTLEAVEERYRNGRTRLEEVGVPEKLEVSKADLTSWSSVYSRFVTHDAKWTDLLPWSAMAKNKRALLKLEQVFRQTLPLAVWRHVGTLDKAGRERLAEVVERSRQWLDIQADWLATRKQVETSESKHRELSTNAFRLGYTSLPQVRDLPGWLALRERVLKDVAIAQAAAQAWGTRAHRGQIRDTLVAHAKRVLDFGSGYPLKENWGRGPGAVLIKSVETLRGDADWDQLLAVRTNLYSGVLGHFISTWRQVQSCEGELQRVLQTRSLVPSETARIGDWWGRGPKVKLVLPVVPRQLPDAETLLEELVPSSNWSTRWTTFIDTTKVDGIGKAAGELKWALNQLDESAKTLPSGEDRLRFANVLKHIQHKPGSDWPLNEIRDAVTAFSPERLRARIAAIDVELETISFEKAKSDWIDRLAKDDDTVTAVDQLEKKIRRSGGIIQPEDHDLFRRAMNAVPIWICTAQAPQHIPLEPDLFDIVVIDEATQCTLTNLLPLVYRGTRLAVIGDGHQLPAIPTIRGTEEQVLAKKYGVHEFLDYIGHDENDVYTTAAQTLPRRRADVVMLTDHYRCHPQIIGFSNNLIYQRELRLRRDPQMHRMLKAGSGVHVVEVTGQVQRGDKGRSWCNPPEADAVAELVASIREKEDSGLSIGVVTPFRGQMDYIIAELDRLDASRNVLIGTAHQFQGDERDIMVFSPVVGKGMPASAAQWVESPPNLINVAITRAKEALFVVGDIEFCSRQDGILKPLARYCRTIQLLRNTSPAELELFSWMCVEGWSPDVHVPLGDIEVDFMLKSPSGEKLAIEVDGKEYHDKRREQDKARDAYLVARGFTALRFDAREVFETPAHVIHRIKERMSAS
jgi:very-short-patch-repair endonuclease